MTSRAGPLLLLALSAALVGCLSKPPPTPTPTTAPTATAAIVVPPSPTATVPLPTATTMPLATLLPTLAAKFLPTAAPTAVVARNQSEGTFAIAMLSAVPLLPGHSYRLLVESGSGVVAFYGQWSTSAVGTDGMPGMNVGLLDASTPATYEIVPPVKVVARDWLYSASVQNKGAGSISLAIVDVTPGG